MAGRAFFRALEDHVLDEMRDAVQLRRFIAVADPDADRHRAHVVDPFGNQTHTVRENSFYIHRFLPTFCLYSFSLFLIALIPI